MSKITDEMNAEIKAEKKASKVVKSYTSFQIAKAVLVIVWLLATGAFAGIVADRSITSTIDSQVQSKTAEQVKSFLADEK